MQTQKNEQRIAILEALLAIDSTNGNEEAVTDYLAACFQQQGIRSEKITFADNRANLVVEIGTGERILGLSGHMDVVAAGDLARWNTDPFTPIQQDGRIYARGATDMKGGLAALAVAMLELEAEKIPLNGRVRLLATVGEEVGLLGSKQLTDLGYVSDLSGLIIAEPTKQQIVYAHKGVLSFKVTSVGQTAHSSMPEKGINAIDHLLTFYQKMMTLFASFTEQNPILGGVVSTNSRIEGGFQVNSVPDFAFFQTNVRTIPEIDNDRIIQELEQLIVDCEEQDPQMQLTLEVTQTNPPVLSDKKSALIQIVQEQASQAWQKAIPLIGVSWAADSAEFIRGNSQLPIVIFGPGNETLHQANEYLEIAEYLSIIDIYKAIITSYLAK